MADKDAFRAFDALLQAIATTSPEWIAREFPADKVYGEGMRNYYSSMEALRCAEPFQCNEDSVLVFLMEWGNHDISAFVAAGLMIVDTLRAAKGQKSMMVEFMEAQGVRPYYIRKDGLMFDADGKFVGKARKARPRWARKVEHGKKRT